MNNNQDAFYSDHDAPAGRQLRDDIPLADHHPAPQSQRPLHPPAALAQQANPYRTPYPEDGNTYAPQSYEYNGGSGPSAQSYTNNSSPTAYTLPPQNSARPDEPLIAHKFNAAQSNDQSRRVMKLDAKWQKRLYWIVPLAILVIILIVLFEVYKGDFERWVEPLTKWLHERQAWSWVLPTVILIVLSFPPLFGHEIVQLVVGLAFPIGVAIGIACAGAVLGEAACFLVFKYGFTWWVDKKIATNVRWAAIARVTQEAGFRGVLVIRYSIVPPHLANPLFSCTGMAFWLYMSTVFLSLPKSIVFVILGNPSSEHSRGARYAKVLAVVILVAVTLFASWWMRKKMKVATKEIESERGIAQVV